MPDLATRLARIQRASDLHWTVESDKVDVELWQGRRQRVHFEAGAEQTRFWSIVANKAQVTSTGAARRDLARRIWRRNTAAELVGFAFDPRQRLIGFIDHTGTPPTDLDLRLYIDTLARDCDHLEYLLSGEDTQ